MYFMTQTHLMVTPGYYPIDVFQGIIRVFQAHQDNIFHGLYPTTTASVDIKELRKMYLYGFYTTCEK